VTRFYDTILGEHAQNGAWGSAKEQGTIAAKNMVEYGSEPFRWVSSYSITHFDFPFLSFGHPTLGDDEAERKYSDTEWRRVAFKDGKICGGVLIGDLSAQSTYKKLMKNERVVADQKETLLQKRVSVEDLELEAATQE
jgi:3-phenylpropionate/trans-cinnamate dioxygenase ferredoxin reductase subunit